MEMTVTVTFTVTLRNMTVLFTPITSEQNQMANVDFVLLWITLFSRLQPCVAVRDRQIRH